MEFNNLVESILESLNETKEASKICLERKYPAKAPTGDSFKKDTGVPSRVDSRKSTTDNYVRTHKNPTTTHAKKFGKREEEERPEEDAEYRGRKVTLNKPTRGDVKKFKVYVKDPKSGNVKKVNFGHGGTSAKRKGEKTMKIRKSNPKARKSFRARHNCDNPGPKTKARYWSCKKW